MLSVILPTANDWADLTAWTLESYAAQTCKDFEIILIDDGNVSEDIYDLAKRDWPFAVRYYVSPRGQESELAHKNHARNVGIRNASGDLLFVCDCDFMVQPDFVEKVLILNRHAGRIAKDFCLYPPCAILEESPFDASDINWDHKFDAFLADYRSHPDRDPALRPIEAHPEGMHLMSRRLFELLGLYDEEFLGWGANKMELQQRINETNIQQFLLEGCLIFHQPHEHATGNEKTREIKRRNLELMAAKAVARKSDEGWQARKKMLNVAGVKVPDPWVQDWHAGRIPVSMLSDRPHDCRIHRKILKQSNPNDPILFIGPWVGEFGWELCRWQGGINKMQIKGSETYTVIACGDPGHHVLYPRAHEYWSLPRCYYEQILTRESHQVLPQEDAALAMAAIKGLLAEELIAKQTRSALVPASFENTRTFKDHVNQDVRKLECSKAAEMEAGFLLEDFHESFAVLFPRQRQLNKVKNWDPDNWNKLIDWLWEEHSIGSIIMGRPEDTRDIRRNEPHVISTIGVQPDRRLDLNVALLKTAACSIGSESGGPFLSLMCGCPAFVMGGREHAERYTKTENFLNTLCTYIEADNYNHPYEETINKIGEFLCLQVKREQPKQIPIKFEDSEPVIRDSNGIPISNMHPSQDPIVHLADRLTVIEERLGIV